MFVFTPWFCHRHGSRKSMMVLAGTSKSPVVYEVNCSKFHVCRSKLVAVINRLTIQFRCLLCPGEIFILVCSVPALLSVTSLQSHWKWEDCILGGMLRIGPCCVPTEVCFGALACLVLCSPVLWGTEQGTSPPPVLGNEPQGSVVHYASLLLLLL